MSSLLSRSDINKLVQATLPWKLHIARFVSPCFEFIYFFSSIFDRYCQFCVLRRDEQKIFLCSVKVLKIQTKKTPNEVFPCRCVGECCCIIIVPPCIVTKANSFGSLMAPQTPAKHSKIYFMSMKFSWKFVHKSAEKFSFFSFEPSERWTSRMDFPFFPAHMLSHLCIHPRAVPSLPHIARFSAFLCTIDPDSTKSPWTVYMNPRDATRF